MIYSLVSEEKTTPKKNQPIKTPKTNKRKNKNINIVLKYKHSLSKFIFCGNEIYFLTPGQSNHRKKKKRSDVDKDETREAN